MKKPIMNSVMLIRFANVCKRVMGFVNVFKKKSCGASPDNGETFISLVNNDMDRKMVEWGWMKKS